MDQAPASPPAVPPPVISVAAALLKNRGRFLIAQRFNGLWEFPGGKQEPGESLGEALVREMKEELDLTVAVGERLMTARHAYPERIIRLHFFWCTLVQGSPRCLDCRDWRWAALSEMAGLEFMAADRQVIRKLAREGDD